MSICSIGTSFGDGLSSADQAAAARGVCPKRRVGNGESETLMAIRMPGGCRRPERTVAGDERVLSM